ncbi:MAG: hypothetical protein GEU28_01450 [Dehalococcoidia bacterium]|nr:hypothetical protein [Dehalococcoidia bacterium]
MIRALLHTDGQLRELDITEASAIARRAEEGVTLWVDIQSEDEESARRLLQDDFGFHYLAVDDCFNRRVDVPKVDDYDDHIFIVAQRLAYDAPNDELIPAELNLFLGKNYVVSYHDTPFPELDQVQHRILEGLHGVERGADFMARTVLDVVVDEYPPAVEGMEEDADQLEDLILSNPSPECLERARRLRANGARLRRAVGPMSDILHRITRGEFPKVVSERNQIFFRDVYDHVVRVQEMATVIREQAELAQSSYLSVTNNRLNEAMRVMAAVTVILTPLAVITGVFGTNFRSGLGYGNSGGVAFLLVVMGLSAALTVAFLRWRRLL